MFGTMISGFEIALVALLIYVLLYALINRICQCFEYCSKMRAIGKMGETGLQIKKEDMEKFVNDGK